MRTSPLRLLARLAIGLVGATVIGVLVLFGALFAYDEAWERWPQETDLATLWAMEVFFVGAPEQRFGGALVTRGGEGLMRFMLATGFDADTSKDGVTPLTLALDLPPGSAVSPQKLEIILKAGADPDLVDGSGSLPIVLAAMNGTAHHVRLLLDYGARPDAADGHGRSVLDGLPDRPSVAGEMVAVLLDHGLDPCGIVHRRWTTPPAEWPLTTWLADHGLADLAARAEAACTANSGAK